MIALVHRSVTILCAVLGLMGSACGKNEGPSDPGGRLCGPSTGIGLAIAGRAEPVEFCLDPDKVSVTFANNRYDVTATMSDKEITFVFQMIFHHHDQPTLLNVTGDLAAAQTDPNSVWLFYEEIPLAGAKISSVAATGGQFNLGISDSSDGVAAGTMDRIGFEMEDASTGDPAGARSITEGFFSIIANSPTSRPE